MCMAPMPGMLWRGSEGSLVPARGPWASLEPTFGSCLLCCASPCVDEDVPNKDVPGQQCHWMTLFAVQDMGCARERGWRQEEGVMELSTLWDWMQKPQRGSRHSLQGQSRGRGRAARAPLQLWGQGCQLASSPRTGVLWCHRARCPSWPGVQHWHGCCGGAGWGRTAEDE